MSIADDLSRLAELRDSGVLSEEEFQAQKAKVLGTASPMKEPAPCPVKKPGKGKGCLIVGGVILALILLIGIIGSNASKKTDVAKPGVANVDASVADHGDDADAQPTTGVTMANFNRVRTGMTYAQVVAVLGEPSQELSRSKIADTETVMYQWDGGMMANMNAMFQNNKLVAKAQMGLR